MRIATISLINNLPISTGGKALSFYVNNTIGENNDVVFYYFENQNNKNEGIIPDSINFTSKYISESRKFNFLFDIINKLHLEFLIFNKALNGIKADSILLEFPYLYHIAKIISRNNNNCPIVLLEHNIEWEYFKGEGSFFWRFIRIFEIFVLKRVNKIITISPSDYSKILDMGINKEIDLIEPGVLSENFSCKGIKKNFSNNKFNLLFYGTLENAVNTEALMFLYNNLSNMINKDCCINICGKNIKSLPDKENVIFHGFVKNIAEYIRGTDIVIVPLNSGAGVKMRIIESLYCGKIVICSELASQGLSPLLRQVVIVCNNMSDYVLNINKLMTDLNYKKTLEKQIVDTVERYNDVNMEKINLIFKK